MISRPTRWMLAAGGALFLGAALFVSTPAEAAPHDPHLRQHLRQHARQHVRRQIRRDLYGHHVHRPVIRHYVHGRHCVATCSCRRPVRLGAWHPYPRRYVYRPYASCGPWYR